MVEKAIMFFVNELRLRARVTKILSEITYNIIPKLLALAVTLCAVTGGVRRGEGCLSAFSQ